MTAVVIAGYIWNRMPYSISEMRPLDDYDVVRFYLMFSTIQKFNLSIKLVKNVEKNPDYSINIGNVDIYIPKVNGLSLEPKEVLSILNKTKLLD